MKINEILNEVYDPFAMDDDDMPSDEMDNTAYRGNLVADLITAKGVIDELGSAADPKDKEMKRFKFKEPTITFVDGSSVKIADTNDIKDPNYLPLKFVDLFLARHSELKPEGAKQMQTDGSKSRIAFFQAIKNAMDGNYGAKKEKSKYDGIPPSRTEPTEY